MDISSRLLKEFVKKINASPDRSFLIKNLPSLTDDQNNSGNTNNNPSTPGKQSGNLPPKLPPNTWAISINNQLGNPSNIFLVAKGLTLNSEACFLDISENPYICNTDLSLGSTFYSISLSKLPFDPNNSSNRLLYVPPMISARIYISLYSKMVLSIGTDASTGNSTINDPDGFNTNDPNYYTIYDKIEFNYNPSNGVYVDCTAVDFFSIPMQLSLPTSTNGLTSAGIALDRTTAINNIKSNIQANTIDQSWYNIFLNYTGYTYGNDNIISQVTLRVSAPGKSMQTDGANPLLNPNYLDNYISEFLESKYGYNLISPIPSQYLYIDCSELQGQKGASILSSYIFTMSISTQNVPHYFNFINADNSYSFTINYPASAPLTSESFFAGGAGNFAFANLTPEAVCVKYLTAAFDVGLLGLPANDLGGINVPLNAANIQSWKSSYYTNIAGANSIVTNGGPWYDLYAQSIHKLSDSVYAFAYDDALGQDGTLHDPNGNSPGALILTLNPLGTNNAIPNPYYDPNKYNISITTGATPNCNSPVKLSGTVVGSASEVTFNNQGIPIYIIYFGSEYEVYLNPEIVLPNANYITIAGVSNGVYEIQVSASENSC